MITLVEALGYRCLRSISQPLGPFHVLVGPNASGKTTFLDVIAFLGRLVSDGIEAAVEERTQNFYDLTWQRTGHRFELAIEARIPEELRGHLARTNFDTVRYEIAVGIDPESQELGLQAETVLLKTGEQPASSQRHLFPEAPTVPASLLSGTDSHEARAIVIKSEGGGVTSLHPETNWAGGLIWTPLSLKLGPRRSALSNLPADESAFPVSVWLKELLTTGVQQLVLNSLLLRKASPPGQPRGFKPDGSNLPWVIADLERRAPERVQQWIAHLQTAFPDIEGIHVVERADDKHRYLVVRYREGVEIPSWMVSDGTLRMLALTLPAYLTDLQGVYLIEEPENGIHPRAIETMFQSLSSVYDAQVLLATHSPVILNIVDADQVLWPGGGAEILFERESALGAISRLR